MDDQPDDQNQFRVKILNVMMRNGQECDVAAYLRPCPVCGKTTTLLEIDAETPGNSRSNTVKAYRRVCIDVGCRTQFAMTVDEANEDWNNQVVVIALENEIKELKERLAHG
jgi:hypothetical protein